MNFFFFVEKKNWKIDNIDFMIPRLCITLLGYKIIVCD